MKALRPRPALFITGSATVYGRVKPEDLPIRETHAVRPISAYGVSKAAQELVGWQYRDSDGFRVWVSRSFNAAGPRQSPDFFLPHLCREVARREAGLEPNTPVPVGSLDVGRDYLDVRDMVRACADLAETPEAEGQPVNVCSGRPVVLRTMADHVRRLARVPIEIRTDENRVPASQDSVAYGDPRLLAELTGFAPRHGIEETVEAVLEYQRRRARD
jgi:GDP-4-dehydro-6-deoxy-D-mannose reductase